MSNIEPEDIAMLEEKEAKEMFKVEEIDSFIYDEEGEETTWKGYSVSLKSDPVNFNWCMRDYAEAVSLCDFLNKHFQPVFADLDELNKLIHELSSYEIRLYQLKEAYELQSEKILLDAAKIKDETGEDIIKARYGGNNDKTRKKYVKESLTKESKEIKDLEFSIEYLARRVSYLKYLIRAKTVLMEL